MTPTEPSETPATRARAAHVVTIRRDIFVMIVAALLLNFLAVIAGVGYAQHNFQRIANREVRDVTRVERSGQAARAYIAARARYELCVAVNNNTKALKSVVEVSFQPGSPIDPLKLPPRARMLYAELVPILVAFNVSSADKKATVEGVIQKPLTCTRPAKPGAKPTATTKSSTKQSSTTT